MGVNNIKVNNEQVISISQELGYSTTDVMSQKAVTDAFATIHGFPWATLIYPGEQSSRQLKFLIPVKQSRGSVSVSIPKNGVFGLVYSKNNRPEVYQIPSGNAFEATVSGFYAVWLYFNTNTKEFYFDGNNGSWTDDCVMLAYINLESFSESDDYSFNVICPSSYSVNGSVYYTHFSKNVLNNINSALGELTEVVPNETNINGFINTDGTPNTSFSGYYHDKYVVSNTSKLYRLYLSYINISNSLPVIACYDDNDVYLGKALTFAEIGAANASPTSNMYGAFKLLSNTAYFYFVHSSGTTKIWTVGTVGKLNIYDLNTHIDAVEGMVDVINDSFNETLTDSSIPILRSNVDGFYTQEGVISTQFSDWKHDIFDISSSITLTSLKGSTLFDTGSGVPVFVFLGETENFLGYYKASAHVTSANPDVYTDEELVGHIPTGTKYVVIQKHPVEYTPTLTASGEANVVNKDNFNALEERVENIEEQISSGGLIQVGDVRPKITFKMNASSFFVRSALNETQDVVIRYNMNHNGYYSPHCAYIGLNTIQNINGFTFSFHNTNDSIAPVETQYWFIGGQHGYLIPTVTMANHGKDNSDIGSWWKDTNDVEYQLVRIVDDVLTFVPKITVDSEGVGHRGWNFGSTVTTLTHVSGASHTSQITIDSQSNVQLVPCTTNVSNKVYCNNVEITPDLYDKEIVCTEVKYVVSGDVFNPATLTKVIPPMEGEEWFNITQTYIFIGLTCSVKQSWKIFAPLKLSAYYGATQPLGLTSYGDYHAFMFNPKVKSVTSNGITTDWKYPQDVAQSGQTWGITHFQNKADHVEDLNNLPERTVQFYKNPNNNEMLVGFASGLSLISSATKSDKRSVNIGPNGTVFHIANDGRNKLYFRVITSNRTAGSVLPVDTTLNFNYYQCYYDPNSGDALTYWYKDGGNYVIYIHSFEINNSAEIEVPEFMEGLNLEVVEKSDNAELLTDGIVNGKLYVGFSSATAEYIVLKTK